MNQNACKFDVIDSSSYFIMLIVIAIQFLFIYFLLNFLNARYKCGQSANPPQKVILFILWMWLLVNFTNSLFNIIAYDQFTISNEDDKGFSMQVILSAVCLFSTRMGPFTLHSIFLFIPCVWIRNTVCRLGEGSLTIEERKMIARAFKLLNVMSIYMRVRMMIIPINLAFVIVMCFNQEMGKYSDTLAVDTIFQASLSILIYTYGFIILFKFKNKLFLTKSIYSRLKIQYFMLILCCVDRLFSNLLILFIWDLSYHLQLNDICRDKNSPSIANYLYISVGYAIMHILPVSTILWIYWPYKSQKSSNQLLFNSVEEDLSSQYSIE